MWVCRRVRVRRPRQRRQASCLPDDLTPEQRFARILRVDHAGEYGAKPIYEGQFAVLGETPVVPVFQEMADGERRHLASFAEALAHREV